MRALVSGASGFIGRSLVERLERDGITVHRLVRKTPRSGEARIDLSERSIDLHQLPNGSLSGIDVVFHLAGEPITPTRWSPAKRERIRASRVASTYILSRAIARADDPPPVFICASAVGYYGDQGDSELGEDAPAGTGFLAEVCRAWESATASAREAGVRVVNTRTGIVIGQGGGVFDAQIKLFQHGFGARLGNGRQWMSWIALEDAIAAFMFVASTPGIKGPCNFSAPAPVRNLDWTRMLASAVGKRALLRVPRSALRLAVGTEVTDEVLLASQRVVPRRLASMGFEFSFSDAEQAIANCLSRPHAERH
jgi:uncharacterized protein (TIGR01777 family)